MLLVCLELLGAPGLVKGCEGVLSCALSRVRAGMVLGSDSVLYSQVLLGQSFQGYSSHA